MCNLPHKSDAQTLSRPCLVTYSARSWWNPQSVFLSWLYIFNTSKRLPMPTTSYINPLQPCVPSPSSGATTDSICPIPDIINDLLPKLNLANDWNYILKDMASKSLNILAQFTLKWTHTCFSRDSLMTKLNNALVFSMQIHHTVDLYYVHS